MNRLEVIKKVNAWLVELGRMHGMQLKLDQDGLCALETQSGVECVLEVPRESSGDLYIYAPILKILQGKEQKVYEKALAMNLFGLETRQAVLSVNLAQNLLILHHILSVEKNDFMSFHNVFSNFLALVTSLKETFGSLTEGSYSAMSMNHLSV